MEIMYAERRSSGVPCLQPSTDQTFFLMVPQQFPGLRRCWNHNWNDWL